LNISALSQAEADVAVEQIVARRIELRTGCGGHKTAGPNGSEIAVVIAQRIPKRIACKEVVRCTRRTILTQVVRGVQRIAVHSFDPPLQGIGVVDSLHSYVAHFSAGQRTMQLVAVARVFLPERKCHGHIQVALHVVARPAVAGGKRFENAVVGIVEVAMILLICTARLVAYLMHVAADEVVAVINSLVALVGGDG